MGPIYQAGTLSGNPLAMAAGEALLTELIKTDPYKSLEMKASYLLDGMAKIMKSNNIDFVKNLPTISLVSFLRVKCQIILKMLWQQMIKYLLIF